MKDQNDKGTLDAFQAPRRGRPPKDSALDGATRQRQLREARKAAGYVDLRLNVTPEHIAAALASLEFDYQTSTDSQHRCRLIGVLHAFRAAAKRHPV